MTDSCVGPLSMLRCNLSSAAALIACGIFVVSSSAAFAQQPATETPEQAQANEAKTKRQRQKAAEQAAQQEAAKPSK